MQSPRLIESILLGCVPVILADSYDLPLSPMLDWDSFSLRVPQGQPEALRAAVEGADYERLRAGVCAVRRFFTWHARPQEGDAFWMTAAAAEAAEAAGELYAGGGGCAAENFSLEERRAESGGGCSVDTDVCTWERPPAHAPARRPVAAGGRLCAAAKNAVSRLLIFLE